MSWLRNKYRITFKFRVWPPKLRLVVFTRDPNPAFICDDCGIYIDSMREPYYMVTNHLWEKYGNGKGMLCVGCLSTRMGRSLSIEDFSKSPINGAILFGASLSR